MIAAGLMLLTAVITWFASAQPAKRIILQEDKPDEVHEQGKKSFGLKQMFISTFGLYLLILVLSSTGNNGINAQIANILPNVYGIDQATTSGLISLAGLLNILFFFVAGAWMSRSGAMPDFITGNIMRLVGAIGLAVLGMVAKSPILLVAASMQIFYQANPFIRLTQPVLAMRFSSIPPGQATGWVIAAAAFGSFLGSLIGGWLADTVGFNAINWMGAIAVGAALLLIIFGLWPAERKKRAAEIAAAESAA
jgi:predicted MFS family arabinose efflux permease